MLGGEGDDVGKDRTDDKPIPTSERCASADQEAIGAGRA